MQQKIQDAIKTLLGTLPVGAELRFYWHDGAQHLSTKLPGAEEQIARLNRIQDGLGVIVPGTTH